MRKPCNQCRSSDPDEVFKKMVKDPVYSCFFIEYENYEEFEDEDYEEFEDEDYEEFEDDLIRANKAAGFQINDDGEVEYLEE